MRILHVCTDFWPNIGGIEKFVRDLCRFSRSAGLETRVLCLNRTAQHPERLPEHDTLEGIRIRRVPFLNLKYYKPAVLPLDELNWPDVLHVHGTIAPLDFLAMTQGWHRRPIVVSTHGGIFHTSTLRRVKQFYFHVLQRPVHHRVSCYAACSRSDFELFRTVSSRVALIENGVDLERFAGVDLQRDRGLTFLCVGRLAANKRVDRVIDVLGRVGGDIQLRVVGPDADGIQGRLETRAKGADLAGRVEFTGEVSDEQLAREYASASFFISASEHEGFGISAVEAMGAGCIPILNDIPAYRSLMGPALVGIITDLGQVEESASAVRKLLQMDLRSQRRLAMENAQRFSWESRMPAWLRIYAAAARSLHTDGRLFAL